MNINFFIHQADKLVGSKMWLSISCFTLALILRIGIIVFTPQNTRFTDLCIYADSGQLIANGINPYIVSDDTLKRKELRTDSFAFNSFTCENQSRWNYYSSSNLPLTLMVFGAIEFAFPYKIIAYRIAFAIGEAFLSLIICLFILNYWSTKNNVIKLLGIFFLGAFSPMLLFDGTFIPEDKGIQSLFMLSAVYFSLKDKSIVNYLLAIFFLGASIAFKGLGIFLVPICYLMLEARELKKYKELFTKSQFNSILKFVIVLSLFTVPYFLFYYPEVFEMALKRLSTETSIAPQHSSIWCVYTYFFGMSKLPIIRSTGLLLFFVLLAYGFVKHSYGVIILTLVSLLIFVNYLLYNGGMNRMNISIIVSLVVLGKYYKIDGLLFVYIIGSCISLICVGVIEVFNLRPDWDIVFGAFNVVYLVYIVYFLVHTLQVNRRKNLLS